MRSLWGGFFNKTRRYRKDESGSATVEAVLWFPIFFYFLALIADASLIFSGETRALRIVQDGNRAFAVGKLTSISAAESFIESRLSQLSPSVTVVTTVNNGVVSSTATMPVSELSGIGIIPEFGGLFIKVTAQQLTEI